MRVVYMWRVARMAVSKRIGVVVWRVATMAVLAVMRIGALRFGLGVVVWTVSPTAVMMIPLIHAPRAGRRVVVMMFCSSDKGKRGSGVDRIPNKLP